MSYVSPFNDLKKAGCDRIFQEKASSAKLKTSAAQAA